MSLADDAKLLLIPTAYKSGKVYSVFPTNGDGDFDYTRSGDASRVNPGGFIETKGANIPRIDHTGGGCPSLLLESQRTNIQIRSEEFDNSAWTKVNSSITANNIIAPDGEMTGDKLTSTSATSTSYIYEQHSLSTSTTYSMSVFVKKGTSNLVQMDLQDFTSGLQGRIKFDLDTETISNVVGTGGVDNYGNGWYRLKCTFTTSATLGTHYVRIFEFSTTSGASLYLFGAQIEIGDYCSSYIKTTTGQVTRFKDECINGGDSDLFNITEGTFFVDSYVYNSGSTTTIGLNDGSDSNKLLLLFQSYGTQVRVFSSGGVSSFLNLTFDQRNKIAVTFKENEYKFFINGALVGSDTIATVPTGMDRLNFSNRTNTANHFEGKVHDTRVYDRVLTEAEAIELTQV